MEYKDLFYTETDELDYRRFLMLRSGAQKLSTSTAVLNVENKDDSSSADSESIFNEGKPQKRRRILTNLEPKDINCPQISPVATSNRKYSKGESSNKENKSCDCLAKLSVENKETSKILVGLTEEVLILKKEIQKLRENATNTNIVRILPKFPFSHSAELAKLEMKMQDNESCFSQLKAEFISIGSRSNPQRFVRDALKAIFTDELATQFTWLGTKQKKSLRSMNVVLALKSAFKERFNCLDDIFETVAKKHFHYAADRISKRNASQLQKTTSASSTPTAC